ncbi:MAG: molecular chaperone DjlA [Desulfobacteraceae bacterium]|nr:MAG: molecular chaperone DjlA [Desulfobacteraceae bacterium]
MSWMGKLVGGAIGFVLGGPIGAIAGATFGHAFDIDDDPHSSIRNTVLSSGETSQLTFFVATFSMLAQLAKADGQISEKEIDSIQSFMTRDLHLDEQSRNVAMRLFHAAIQSPEPFSEFATQFFNQFQAQPQFLTLMIDILVRVSVSDGRMSHKEESLILEAVRIFRFNLDTYRHIKSKYVEDFQKYYAVLNSEQTDTNEQIKKQYRKLVFEYHPDKIASKGFPEEFIRFANDKFREIQEAYEIIRKERRM